MTIVNLAQHHRGKSAFTDLMDEIAARQPMVCRCERCDWSLAGTLTETRHAFTAHREQAHPEIVPTMPNVRATLLGGALAVAKLAAAA